MVDSVRPTCLACNPKTEASVFSSGAARLEKNIKNCKELQVPLLCKLANYERPYDALVWNDKGSSYAS